MKFTYSIIIPHKNTPKLLQRCLDSIPQREDLEVIVIDDNSDPEIVDFDNFPGKDRQDTTIIFDKCGKGAGRARNVGLEHVKGKWLLFADADDYFYPEAFFELDKLKDSDYDIVYFYCNSRDGKTGELIPDRGPYIKRGIDTLDYDLLRYKSYSPWGKLIKRKLVYLNHLTFDEVIASNDVMFSTKAGHYAKKISTISTPLYCTTKNEWSLVYSPDINKIKSRIKVASRLNDFLYQHRLQRYRQYGIKWIYYFFPKHPLLLMWAIFKLRYKGDNILYLRMLKRGLSNKIRTLNNSKKYRLSKD